MGFRIGIDVGGTFTDFQVVADNEAPRVHKILSTPGDPSIAVIDGLAEIAAALEPPMTVEGFLGSVELIVHGTTVTTNAVLTGQGARTALLTTRGVRDALEMRRGAREERYDNRYTNVPPLVPRYLRVPIGGRLDGRGQTLEPLCLDDVRDAVSFLREQQVEAVAICFMNAFANPQQEQEAAEMVRRELPGAYLTVSTDLLASIRFYNRVSTTVLNSYVGPGLQRYLDGLTRRLQEAGFGGVLLIMQSNGGVVAPNVARQKAALTLLSGPAAGPTAGLEYARSVGHNSCITIDMGGTSFDACLIVDNPIMVTEGDINRYRIALPMLGIHTIGAGGGSIGWIDAGGLLRMGPQSAGADPGPASYGRGGTLPTSTDANLILGYLDADFFAGGKMRLDVAAARKAVEEHVARPMGISCEEAAAGMYRIICTDMSQGVREITIERGFDPREFPVVVAGGAGPLHACMIGHELDIPVLVVPRDSSIFCAAGMLMSDLKHDFVHTVVMRLDTEKTDWERLNELVSSMQAAGDAMLGDENIPEERRRHILKLDCRYVRQYHEVSFEVPLATLRGRDVSAITAAFHREHNRLYGYSNDDGATPVELINIRLTSVGVTARPRFPVESYAGETASAALKSKRQVYVPSKNGAGVFREVSVFDGHRLRFGNRVPGPALVEQVNTTLFVTDGFDAVCDRHGSIMVYAKGREDLVKSVEPAEMAGIAGVEERA